MVWPLFLAIKFRDSIHSLFLNCFVVFQSGSVQKSVSDDRDYWFIGLPNQMRVLLISDAKADKVFLSMHRFFITMQFGGLA